MIGVRSGSYAALNRHQEALAGLISTGEIKEMEAYVPEYMLGHPEIVSCPHLSVQLARDILGKKPFDLFDGSSAREAYNAWRYYSYLEEEISVNHSILLVPF